MNTEMFKQAQKIVADNSAALLTGTGVIGVLTTAVLTGRATVKACEIIAKHERHSYDVVKNMDDGLDETPVEICQEKLYTLDSVDKVKLTWPLFIPAVASGVTTMSAIVFSYRISASRSAVLAAAYGMSEKAFSEYKEKVLEQVTPKKANDIRDAVDQQKIEDNPPPTSTTFVIGENEVLCLDSFSGRYFKSNPAKIDRAANEMNAEIGNNHVARLSSFYNKIGLGDADAFGDFIWDMNNYCEVEYTTQMTDDQRPCLVLNFVQAPKPRYGQGYD